MSNEQELQQGINKAFSVWLNKRNAEALQEQVARDVLHRVQVLLTKTMRMEHSSADFLKSFHEIAQDLTKCVQSDSKDTEEKLLLSPEELSLLRSVAAHRVMEGGGAPSVQCDLENMINAFRTIHRCCSCPLSACG